MNNWPQTKSVVSEEEREKTYLSLVDMFVDLVEPSVIHMILQDKDWDLNAALEDIMVLSSSSQSNKTNPKSNPSSARPKSETGLDTIKMSYSPFTTNKSRSSQINALSHSMQFDNTTSSHGKRSSMPTMKTVQNKHEQPGKSSNSILKESKAFMLPFVEHYNYVKTMIPRPYDRAVMLIRADMKIMVILRGLPGSGKSNLAGKLLTEAGIDPSVHKRHVFSTDNFFMQKGCYVYVRELIGEAHAWNQRNVLAAVKEEVNPIVVDNTNIEAWEMKVYAEFAVSAGYDIEVLEPDTWWAKKEGELVKRNVHGVPRGSIRSMLERYEKGISAHTILQRFQLLYSLANAPPQPARNCKWKDRFGEQKNNKPKKKRTPNKNNNGNLNSPFLPDMPQQPSVSDIFQNVPISIVTNPVTNNTVVDVCPFENTENFTVAEDFRVSCQNYGEKPQTSNNDLGSVLKLFSTPAVSNPFVLQGNLNSDLQNFTDVKSGSVTCKTQNSFDFMAESNKLLAALKKPQFSNESLTSCNRSVSEPKELKGGQNIPVESDLIPSSEPVPSTSEGYNCNQMNQICSDILGQSESTEIAQGLVNSIIDTLQTEKTDDTNQQMSDKDKEVKNNEKSMDYVLVNEDDTYKYQRLDSTPFCTNPFSEDFKCPATNLPFDSFIQSVGDLETGDIFVGDLSNEHSDVLEGIKKLDIKSEIEDYITHVSLLNASDKFDGLTDSTDDSFENSKKEETKPVLETDNSKLLGMMDEILKSMTPACEDPAISTSCSPEKLQNCQPLNLPPGNLENEAPSKNAYSDWGLGAYWSTELDKVHEPKPARNLIRSKPSPCLKNEQPTREPDKEIPDELNSWGPIKDSFDDWSLLEDTYVSPFVQKPTVLPQRKRVNNKTLIDASTNTNYVDFSLVNGEDLEGTKVLIGHRRSITTAEDDSWQSKNEVVESLLLDKSTMTLENHLEDAKNYDISLITSLFPNIPEYFISDVVEKCQGDVNWAVDILLDSEHSIYPESNLEPPPPVLEPSIESTEKSETENLRQNPKPPNPEKLAEAKRIIENVIVFGKSHYSNKVLKILKRKHPEYTNLIEQEQPVSESSSSGKSDSPEIIGTDNGAVASSSSNETGDSSSTNEETTGSDEESSSSTTKSEDSDDYEDLQLIFNSDLILQLQQKFGNASLPRMPNVSPVVRLPVGLARQLYGYIMDSLQSQVDEQQDEIESMIAQDEEIAKLLQYEDVKTNQTLQEIMDLEMALRVHRADQEEWKKSDESVAAKLSKNILLERFPQVDPKVLEEVLHVHNYSLHDTDSSLRLALEGPGPSTSNAPGTQMPLSGVRGEDGGEEEEEEGEMDALSEAQSHRDQAATYYGMRIDCLAKAQQAFRAGNKPVASYYSNLARLHKDRIEKCNSRAAACLLESHRCGSDTLDLHFLHVSEAQVVLDMFLDKIVAETRDRNRRGQTVFLITGRGARSAGGVSRIKPLVQRILNQRGIPFGEINPGMLHATIKMDTPLSCAS